MSTVDDGGGTIVDHEHGTDPPARVFIDGTEIPVINNGLTVEMRKNGPADIVRMADVYFPIQWPNDGAYDTIVSNGAWATARIEVWNWETRTYIPVLDGYVSAVGGGGKTSNTLRARIKDPSIFLSNINITAAYGGYTGAFGGDVTGTTVVSEILTDVVTTFIDGQPVFDDVDFRAETADNVRSRTYPGINQTLSSILVDLVTNLTPTDRNDLVTKAKKFTRNKHTLSDVLDWLTERLGAFYYFAPAEDGGITLVLTTAPHDTHRATPDIDSDNDRADTYDSTVTLRRNDALAELRPINTVEVRGDTGLQVELGPLETTLPTGGDKFPTATAVHERLLDRADGAVLKKVYETGAVTKTEAKQQAKRRLKDLLDDTSGGSLSLFPAGQVTPYDILTAEPACNTILASDIQPLRYEVERVRHVLRANADERDPWRTIVEPSLAAPMYDIVTTAQMASLESKSQIIDDNNQDEPPDDYDSGGGGGGSGFMIET